MTECRDMTFFFSALNSFYIIHAKMPVTGNSSPIAAGFNIVNTIIGSGILALPYALKEAGFYFGIVTLVIMSLFTAFALNALIYGGRHIGAYRYGAVSSAALGRPGYWLLYFAIAVNSIGSCISYLIIIGDTMTPLVQGIPFAVVSRQSVVALSSIAFTLPLLFFRTLEPLVKPSVISTLCLPVIVLIVAIRGPFYAPPEPVPMPVMGPSVLPALGVIAFAYSCTQTCYQVYQTLNTKTLKAWNRAAIFATILAAIIYLTFSIVSYQSFGLATQPNLLNNFDNDDKLANVARLLLAFSLTFTYPMQFYPIRDMLGESLNLLPSSDEEANRPMDVRLHLMSLALFTATLVTALVVDDLGFVFKLIGTAASSLLIFVLPAIIYLRIVSPYFVSDSLKSNVPDEQTALIARVPGHMDSEGDEEAISEPTTSVVSAVLLVMGVGVFVVGSWAAIHEYIVS